MSKFYGETKSEINANDMLQCRQIVSEITGFGVKQDQILQIIKLLSLELEDRDQMMTINECIQELLTDGVVDKNSFDGLITS
jgi:hypothetical protein